MKFLGYLCKSQITRNCGLGAFGVISAITIFLSLLLSALHVVEINHFGLKYRTLDHIVTDQIYTSGRTFSGIATGFIQYPTTYIIFEFSGESDADVSYQTANYDFLSSQCSRLGRTTAKPSTWSCPSSRVS